MEEPYGGYTHELESGGSVEHLLSPGTADRPPAILLWAKGPGQHARLSPDEAVVLATTLLRDVLLAKHGHG